MNPLNLDFALLFGAGERVVRGFPTGTEEFDFALGGLTAD